MTAREPVEGWREIDPYLHRLELAYGPTLIVQSDWPEEWWFLVQSEHHGPFSLKAAKLAAEDYAKQQLKAALDALEPAK